MNNERLHVFHQIASATGTLCLISWRCEDITPSAGPFSGFFRYFNDKITATTRPFGRHYRDIMILRCQYHVL